jgi:hypothetical protein
VKRIKQNKSSGFSPRSETLQTVTEKWLAHFQTDIRAAEDSINSLMQAIEEKYYKIHIENYSSIQILSGGVKAYEPGLCAL